MMKSVLITGCSSGFGLAMVHEFLNAGWCVIATARSPEKIVNLTQLEHPGLTLLRLDVTSVEDRKQLQLFISAKLNNRLDCLINNAGMGVVGIFEEYSESQIRQQFEVNLFGLIFVTQSCLPALRNAKGRVINISSAFGFFAPPMYSIYSASKYAVEGWSESLFYELLPHEVKVTLIEPGSIKTNFEANVHNAENKLNAPIYLKQYSDYARMVEKYSKFTANVTSRHVATKALQLANLKNIPLRTRVGHDSKLLYILRKVLPESIFIKLLRKKLGLIYS